MREGRLGIREVLRSRKGKKIRSVAAWDDPIPLAIRHFTLGIGALKGLFYKLRMAVKR